MHHVEDPKDHWLETGIEHIRLICHTLKEGMVIILLFKFSIPIVLWYIILKLGKDTTQMLQH